MPKGQPWEVCLTFSAWKRQVLTVAETLDGKFPGYLGNVFLAAEERQATCIRGGDPGPLPEITKRSMEWENRVVATKLRVLHLQLLGLHTVSGETSRRNCGPDSP